MSFSVESFGGTATVLKLADHTEVLYYGNTPTAVKTDTFTAVSNRFLDTKKMHTINLFFDGKDHDVVLPQEELNQMVEAI